VFATNFLVEKKLITYRYTGISSDPGVWFKMQNRSTVYDNMFLLIAIVLPSVGKKRATSL
jgi:hypothetical protein